MAALTLAQYAQAEKRAFKRGVYKGIIKEGIIADILTWRSLNGSLSESGLRRDEVIRPDWIALGGSISSKTANLKPISYGTYEMAVHLDIPIPLEDAGGDQQERSSTTQVQAALDGFKYELNDVFINGDQAVDANQFEGLNKLVASLPSSQTVGATEIDISDGGDATEQLAVINRMLDAHLAVSGGKPDFAFCNREFASRFRSIALSQNLLGDHHNWLKDTFNPRDPRPHMSTAATRPIFVFDGVPYYDLGLKTDQSTRIIANTYSEAGSSAAATRVFLVKYGEDELEGIQSSPLDVIDIGTLEDTDVKRKRVKWMPGLACWGPKSIVKVQGIKVA